MGNTVIINTSQWNGNRGSIHYVIASDGTALTTTNLLDISALGAPAPNSIKIRSIDCLLNGDYRIDFLMDATTDQTIESFTGQSDVSIQIIRDYTDLPSGGKVGDSSAAGWVGDLLVTTTSMANGDELNLLIVFEKSS